MGQLVKGGLLRPLDTYARGLRLGGPLVRAAARPQQLLARRQAVRQRQPLRRLADGRDRRRLLQQGQGRPRRPRRSPSFEAAARQGQAARRRPDPRSATSTSGPASTSSRPSQTSSPTSRLRARLRVRPRRRVLRHAGEPARRPRSSRSWATKGYFTPDFNGTGYDPAWQQFAKGKGPFLIAGTWLIADLAEAMGDNVGFFLMPRRGGGRRPGGARRREPAVRHHPEVQEPGRGGRLHRLHHQPGRGARCWPRPATCRRCRPDAQPTRRVAGDMFDGLEDAERRGRAVPYIDYATPTFYDDFTAVAMQRLLAGQAREPRRTFGEDHRRTELTTKFDRASAAATTPPPARRRTAGRAAARRLPVPAAGARGLRAVRALPARAQRVAVAVRVGRRHAAAAGSGSTTTRQVVSDPALRAAFEHALVLHRASTRCCRWPSACCSPRRMSRARVRGLAAFRTRAVPAAGRGDRRRRRDVAHDLRARRRAAQRGPAGRRARRWAGLARRLRRSRCRPSA